MSCYYSPTNGDIFVFVVGKHQRKPDAVILLGNVQSRSRLAIIGRPYTLQDITIFVDNYPNLFLFQFGKATDESVDASCGLHCFSLFLYSCYTYLIGNCKRKKLDEKIFFFGMIFAAANLAGSLAQDLLWLPFWQLARPICHFGSRSVCHYGSVEPCGLGATVFRMGVSPPTSTGSPESVAHEIPLAFVKVYAFEHFRFGFHYDHGTATNVGHLCNLASKPATIIPRTIKIHSGGSGENRIHFRFPSMGFVSFCYLSTIGYRQLQIKKIREKKRFFWHDICSCYRSCFPTNGGLLPSPPMGGFSVFPQ